MNDQKNIHAVKYMGVQATANFIKEKGIETVIKDLADEIEANFKRWREFDLAPRYASHSDIGVIELMPTADNDLFGFKYVNGHPGNFKKDLMTVVAFGVLSGVETGYPLLLAEMTLGTALRTAATSALAAKYLAPKNAKTMALIGLGSQAEFQAYAFKSLQGIETIQIYDIDPTSTAKFKHNMKDTGLNIVEAPSPQTAVKGAQIITTVTADKKQATILSDNMVGAGVHINGIGGDCPSKTELAASIVARSNVFVELEAQTRIEGEIQQMPDDFEVTELWRVFTGEQKGRTSSHEITLFDSVGIALEDFSYLSYLAKQIEGTDFYEELDLITKPDNPRDLFGLLTER